MQPDLNSDHLPSLVTPPRRDRAGQVAEANILDPAPPVAASPRAADAALFEAQAKLKRAEVEASPASAARGGLREEAERLEAQATRVRDPAACGLPELRVGRGREVSPLPGSNMPLNIRQVAETVQASPDTLAAEATMDRLTLAREAGVLTLAVEAAESSGAEGAVEQMLVHGMAAAYCLAMQLMTSAGKELRTHERSRMSGEAEGALAGAARSATSAARLMDTFNRAALVLDRLQHGGRQHVTVQHMVVADGGQAVVAGNVVPGRGRASPGRRLGGGGGL